MGDRPARRSANRRFHALYGTAYKSDSLGSTRLEKGARLQVYWPDDQAWYFGKVECYNTKSGRHVIRYDDDDKEELDLDKEVWEPLVDISSDVNEEHQQQSLNSKKEKREEEIKNGDDQTKQAQLQPQSQPQTQTQSQTQSQSILEPKPTSVSKSRSKSKPKPKPGSSTAPEAKEKKRKKTSKERPKAVVVALDTNGIHVPGHENYGPHDSVEAKAALMTAINENGLGSYQTTFHRKASEIEETTRLVDQDDTGLDREEEGARALTDLYFHPTSKRRKTRNFVSVGHWLTALGLSKYDAQFQVHDIDLEVLPYITMEDLREIGIPTVGHRRKLLINLPVS